MGGNPFTVTVTILGTAFYGGVPVALSSNGPELIPPATATVPYNFTTKTVTVNTIPVAALVQRVLTATYNGVTRTKTVAIRP